MYMCIHIYIYIYTHTTLGLSRRDPAGVFLLRRVLLLLLQVRSANLSTLYKYYYYY